jgi:hypothetical protein
MAVHQADRYRGLAVLVRSYRYAFVLCQYQSEGGNPREAGAGRQR